MAGTDLERDCSKCAALCCVALAFDRSALFAADKAAGEPCRHLEAGFGCAIHDARREHGYGGCLQYDCHGAGQRVVQEVFAGRSWREDPALARRMFDAFSAMRKVHDLLLLLEMTEELPLSSGERERCGALVAALSPDGGWTEAALEGFGGSGLAEDVQAFLGGLGQDARRAAAAGASGRRSR